MILHLTSTEVLVGLGALVALVIVWRIAARATRRAAETARAGARLLSLTGRVTVTAALIVAVQWVVLTHPTDRVLVWVVLGLPALLAAYTLTRALTVAAVDGERRRGGRR